VVDWKTGAVPDASRLPALSVQLSVYRLAWAALAGCPQERVRAAFVYVRAGVTLRPEAMTPGAGSGPSGLLGAAGLRALVEGVPVAD